VIFAGQGAVAVGLSTGTTYRLVGADTNTIVFAPGTLTAYAAIFPRVTQLPEHQLIGLPAVEIYQTARVNARLQLNVTDICLPIST
jgi:hypothetical protein